MEELQARHRKELKELQGRVTQKKKQASKKTRKGVNDECDRLEAELKQQHAEEIAALNGSASDQADEQSTSIATELDDLQISNDDDRDLNGGTTAAVTTADDKTNDTTTRKPNRQKARLARRAAEQEEIARQAAEEAANLPDMKQQERGRMLEYMKERKLQEKEIRADGHCLYSAVADQLNLLGIPLSTTPDEATPLPYKATRAAAASYIEQHQDDFAAFMDEPLPDYVHKIRDTAEWGGQLELKALAKSYDVEINVLQDFGRVEKIEPDEKKDDRSIWLGYYKHGFGLGEHYNSLRKLPG
ncbi:hypothetical protein MRB53_038979 [Persea americana]|nr:hypothetical protein MRB53_038979 [Persea americana]